MKSYRHERMRELKDCVEERNNRAGKVALTLIKARTPIGTPESTGHPNYVITRQLQNSIELHPDGLDGFSIGTKLHYAPYVHNGTYSNPLKHGRGEWSETDAKALNAIRVTEYGQFPDPKGKADGNKGVPARAFLVYGLLSGRAAYKAIYGTQCKGGPPYG